jgi:ribosomal protein S1
MTLAVINRPSEVRQSMRAEHESAVRNVEKEAEAIAGNAQRIAMAIREALDSGGIVQVQPQVAFITGSLMRLVKDLGVAEHLQKHGVAAQRRALVRRRG